VFVQKSEGGHNLSHVSLHRSGCPADVYTTVLIGASCPAAATGTMMAIRYKQNYTYSSEIFALTTALAVFTIPAVVFLSELVL